MVKIDYKRFDNLLNILETVYEYPGLISPFVRKGHCFFCIELALFSERENEIYDFPEYFVCDDIEYRKTYPDNVYDFIWRINREYMQRYERCAFPTYIAAWLFFDKDSWDVIQEKVERYRKKWSDFLSQLCSKYLTETGELDVFGESDFYEDLDFILGDIHNMFRETVGKNKKRV